MRADRRMVNHYRCAEEHFAGRAALPGREHRAIQALSDHHVLRHEALGRPWVVQMMSSSTLQPDVAIVGGHKVLRYILRPISTISFFALSSVDSDAFASSFTCFYFFQSAPFHGVRPFSVCLCLNRLPMPLRTCYRVKGVYQCQHLFQKKTCRCHKH